MDSPPSLLKLFLIQCMFRKWFKIHLSLAPFLVHTTRVAPAALLVENEGYFGLDNKMFSLDLQNNEAKITLEGQQKDSFG